MIEYFSVGELLIVVALGVIDVISRAQSCRTISMAITLYMWQYYLYTLTTSVSNRKVYNAHCIH